MLRPSLADPSPGGNPAPVGNTEISRARSSSGAGAFPRLCFPPCAKTIRAVMSKYPNSKNLDMGHLAVCEDSPNFDPVVMVCGILAADSKKFVVRRLHVYRLVHASRL